MTLPNGIKIVAQERRRDSDVVRPELTNRTDRIWLIIEPGLKNFAPSEIGLISDFIVAKLREYRLNAELAIINTELERPRKERRTK